jgi:hypothetical protein
LTGSVGPFAIPVRKTKIALKMGNLSLRENLFDNNIDQPNGQKNGYSCNYKFHIFFGLDKLKTANQP